MRSLECIRGDLVWKTASAVSFFPSLNTVLFPRFRAYYPLSFLTEWDNIYSDFSVVAIQCVFQCEGLYNIAEHLFIFPSWNSNYLLLVSHRLYKSKSLSDIIMPVNLNQLASSQTIFSQISVLTNASNIEDHGISIAVIRAKQICQ